MANVVVTLKIMPKSPKEDLAKIEGRAKGLIAEFAGEGEVRAVQEPVAFGLKALKMMFVMDEAKGSTEELEAGIAKIRGVQSVETVDVRRAIG